jgi:LuxR family maltose regulon positive regulatory protein/serine/threonine-protein kinase PknK
MDSKTRPTQAVSTKFQPPTYDDGLVSRDRLIDLLREGRSKRLALIHAPAGFGKTTLAVQWQRLLRAEGVVVAWLSLDRDDNDVVWFVSHLVEAVHRVAPELTAELVDVLEQQSDDVQRYVLTGLVNQVATHRGTLAIVLDDWHVIDDPMAAAALEFLLDSSPDNLHLIVTSRTQSPAVGRLRVRNQVTEIDATALRFDHKESAAFLLDLNALALDSDDIRQLWSSTDGWIAALQLASLSLRNSDDPSAFIRSFSGRHRSLGDYLAENVLNGLPLDLLDFLLTTSVCERLCGDLAAAVSGQVRGQALLEELERRDMFLRPLDDNREWFRYHHLFASYLRRRLERDHADRIVTLHRTAAAWFDGRQLLSEAVTHALAAGDDTEAVDLVERRAMHLVEHSRMATLLGLVNKLPRALLPERPALQIAIAWANCLLQRAQPAQLALDYPRTALASASDDIGKEILGEADIVQAAIDIYGDRINRAATLVAPYIVDNPRHRPWLVAVSTNIQTFVDIHTFAYDTAQARQRWANPFHETTRGPYAGVYGRCFAGLAAFAQLDLITAEQRYQEAVALATAAAGQHSHAARLAGALVGRLHYERGETEAAERLLEECRELGAESGVPDFLITTYTTLARIKALRGDIDGVWSLLQEGEEAARQLALPRLLAAIDHERVRLHLAFGQVDRAQSVLDRHVDDIVAGDDGIAMATRHYQLAMCAQVMSANADYAGAIRLLTRIRDETSSTPWRYGETVARAQLAAVLSLNGDADAAVRTLIPALIAGAESGLVRTIIDAGPEPLKLIGELREASRCRRWPAGLPTVSSDYLSKVLATAHADSRKAAIRIVARPAERYSTPEEPLSTREVHILHLLDRGLSNKEIAHNLGLTINTVKWYLKSIYTKLGVARRGESVSEARRRRILT